MEPLDADAWLMLRYRQGDAGAFLLLYATTAPWIFLEFAEQQSALLAALGSLPQKQRGAFLLHEEAGLTIE